MFLNLINLYSKNLITCKTPLEDFNTECFAGILNIYFEIKSDFFYNFLKLPKDDYEIKTQYRRELIDEQRCIIDLAFIGKQNICFIENKIESSEGYEQLTRYGKILDTHFNEAKKYLFYCTKYSELKNENNNYDCYNFKQFKWFEVAKFLKKYSKDNLIVKDYLIFLKKYGMEQDNTFKIENLMSMENILKTIEIVEFHINNSKENFHKLFGSQKYNSNFNWTQLREHGRFCHYNSKVLDSDTNKYSEILYSIEFESLSLNCHLYVSSDNEQIDNFKKINFNNPCLVLENNPWGSAVYRNENLGKFLNDDNSDTLIKNWFLESFYIFKQLIDSNPQIKWNKPPQINEVEETNSKTNDN